MNSIKRLCKSNCCMDNSVLGKFYFLIVCIYR